MREQEALSSLWWCQLMMLHHQEAKSEWEQFILPSFWSLVMRGVCGTHRQPSVRSSLPLKPQNRLKKVNGKKCHENVMSLEHHFCYDDCPMLRVQLWGGGTEESAPDPVVSLTPNLDPLDLHVRVMEAWDPRMGDPRASTHWTRARAWGTSLPWACTLALAIGQEERCEGKCQPLYDHSPRDPKRRPKRRSLVGRSGLKTLFQKLSTIFISWQTDKALKLSSHAISFWIVSKAHCTDTQGLTFPNGPTILP